MTLKSIAKMDLYSDMRIPFNVAAYARQRKYSADAVALSQAIMAVNAAQAAFEKAEEVRDAAEKKLHKLCAHIESRMETANV